MSKRIKTSLLASLVSIAVASGFNLAIFYTAIELGYLNPEINAGPNGSAILLNGFNIIGASTVPLLIGVLVYLLILRFSNSPKWVYWTLSLLMLFLSFINPFMVPGIEISTAISLNIMHIVCALSSAVFVTRIVK